MRSLQKSVREAVSESDVRGALFCAVRSVLAERSANPFLVEKTARDLSEEFSKGTTSLLPSVMTAMGRVSRIVKGQSTDGDVFSSQFLQTEETNLWEAYQTTKAKVTVTDTI